MKITVINATEKHGVTYRMKEIFLEKFRQSGAEITEYCLPKDCRTMQGALHKADPEYTAGFSE